MTEPAGNLETQDPSLSADILDALGTIEDDEMELSDVSVDEAEEELSLDSEADGEAAEVSDEPEAEAPAVEAPEHWSPADREMVSALAEVDPEAAQWLMDQKKNIEKDAQKKWQEAADMRKQNEYAIGLANHTRQMLSGIVSQYPPHAGMNEAKAVQMLAAWWSGLVNPQTREAAFTDLANQLGYNPAGSAEDEDVDPQVAALQQEIRELKGNQQQAITQQQAQQWQQQQSALHAQQSQASNQIQQFMEATDETGALKHPHFSKVGRLMGVILKADSDAGGAMGMEDAYQLAVQQQGLQNESPAQRLRKAKRAASGVRSKRGSNETDPDISDYDLITGIIDGKIN